jgi:hypothetical protein
LHYGQIGTSGLADRDLLIDHLRRLAAGDEVAYDQRRRRKVATYLDSLRKLWVESSRLVVEAPPAVINQRIAGLPEGVTLKPGEITVRFSTAQEALEKLLALAMAPGNEYEDFAAAIVISEP